MSFDELPPDSASPRESAEETPVSAQEASVQDAPPTGTTRRRRGTRTGTDAASSSPTAEPTPQRARRTKKQAPQPEPEDRTSEVIPSPPSPAADAAASSPPPKRAARSSTRRSTETPQTADEAPPQRSRRRAKATAPAEQPDVAEASELPQPPKQEKPKPRSRSRQPVRPVVEDTSPAPAPPDTTEAVPVKNSSRTRKSKAPAEETPAEPAAEEAKPAPRARTRSRSKRVIEARVEAAPVVSEEAVAEPDSEPTERPETPGTRTSRNRRSRGRGKRETKTGRPETPEIVEPEVVPEPPIIPKRIIDRTVGSHLVLRNGVPTIKINDVAFPPVLFFGNLQETANRQRVISEVRRAARAGVHLHSTLVELPCPLSEATEALDTIDSAIRAILDADPDGYVMPRIVFVPARGWKREYATEIATYADGPSADPSLTSERFWREAEHSLQTLVSHLRDYEWSGRVFGYHLERGEWFQPADQGYDRSMANREAFRDWLRVKYKNSLVALRAAWYDGDVQFHTAEIPPVIAKPNDQRAFYETRRERRTIDFCSFTSESTADRLIALAGAMKRAADDKALVSVCYGYTFEFGHGHSGHLALCKVLECEDIDLICGPPSYRDRKPGGAASMPGPIHSPALHGKLWLSEDDTKTFLAPVTKDDDDFNPRLSDRFQTEQAYARAMGRAYATETGVGFMDLWGEGWLDDDALWERMGGFAQRYSKLLDIEPARKRADAIVLFDEKSLLHIQRGEAFFRKITSGFREMLQRSGVNYEVYLQSDLLDPAFPTDAKLYFFANPYRLTSDQRAAIAEKLQGNGRTLAWLYAPGSCEERPQIGGAMEESATGAVGLTLRQQEWNSEIGSRVVEQRHPITEKLSAREIGVRERLNPSFYVDDPDATVLAEYIGSGLPSIAIKKNGDWQTVFVGEPTLNWDLFRGICRFAGVHLWTGGDDVAFIGHGWLTVHAHRDGHRAIRTPEPTGLYDLTDRRLVGTDVREHRFFMKAGTTRTFSTGPIARFQEIGLPNLNAPLTPTERPAQPVAPDPEPVLPLPVTVPLAGLSEDMQTLQAVLSMDLSLVEDVPIEGWEIGNNDRSAPVRIEDSAEVEARLAALLPAPEAAAAGRRRRRRGGRGRGRRRADEGTNPTGADGAAVPSSDGLPAENNGERPPMTHAITESGVQEDVIDSEFVASPHGDDFEDGPE